MRLTTKEALIACAVGIAIGTAAESILTLALLLAIGMAVFVLARVTMKIRWTRHGTRTDVEILGGAITIKKSKPRKKAL